MKKEKIKEGGIMELAIIKDNGEIITIVKDIDKYDFAREDGLINLAEHVMEMTQAEKETK